MDNNINQFQNTVLQKVIETAIRNLSLSINCVLIGTIEAYYPATQTVDISINYQKVIEKDFGYPNQYLAFPLLVKCPVFVLQGGGAYLSFPIIKGDSCIVIFNDRELDTWMASGQITYPHSGRAHDLNDGIAIVGIRSLTNPLPTLRTDIASIVDSTGERLTQAGFLQPYAGIIAPSGWLLCYGQSISVTAYPILFAIIGYIYGGGGGSFNVPDLRGRTVAGLDNMGGSDANVLTNTYNPNRNTLGGDTGEEAHQLTIPELPAHHHTYLRATSAGNYDGSSSPLFNTNVTDNTGDTGSNVPHQTVQPTLMINWIIKI